MQTSEYNLIKIIDQTAKEKNLSFSSCIEFGPGNNPLHDWFKKYNKAKNAKDYICIELDNNISSKLLARNINTYSDIIQSPLKIADLTLALEVLEHIPENDLLIFLEKIKAATNVMFACTTPNFEHWDETLKPLPEVKECRYIPDHFPYYKPKSTNPHHHKTAMTPEKMFNLLSQVFPLDTWYINVYRAWPWKISDLARNSTYQLYFKLFGMVVKKI